MSSCIEHLVSDIQHLADSIQHLALDRIGSMMNARFSDCLQTMPDDRLKLISGKVFAGNKLAQIPNPSSKKSQTVYVCLFNLVFFGIL